jgi:protein involved in polysaccharide export with SLBB domain
LEYAVIKAVPQILGFRLLAAVFLVLAAGAGLAQSINLSPEQQAMLNQLPPAQRQQALDALEELQQQQASQAEAPEIAQDEAIQGSGDDPLARLQPEIEEPSASAASRLVINFEPRFDLKRDELRALEQDSALVRIQGSQYFELDDRGVLAIPGLPEIPLLGLTQESIEARLGAEPALKPFDISVFLLDVRSEAAEALEPFGYDVFGTRATGFQPVTSGPVPPDYVLGPGDSIRVQLFGNVNGIYEFEVSRDGILNLPELGPITVAGLPFSEFRQDLNRRVEQMLIGTQVSVTMGELRTIQVFVLGDVNWPGSYVVSSLATISSALYKSGGISEIGSLRRVQLKRNGRVAASLDLYDLLLRGDTSGDKRLQPGDVIFIPPVGDTVGVAGAVRRPAIYELRGETQVDELIALAGGLRAVAYPAAARIERIDDANRRITVSVDIDSTEGAGTNLADGDTLYVPEVLPRLQDSVMLVGHVHRPGAFQLRSGMRLADLIPSANQLLPGADTGYILIRRENDLNNVYVASANLGEAWANPGSPENLLLQARDTVHVFSLAFGRQRIIQPLLEELNLQARAGEPFSEVSISGSVKAPGIYPLEGSMRVSDLIRAGGSLAEEAYTLRAELARYEIVNGEFRNSVVIDVDLDAILMGNLEADLVLQEHDNLRISAVPSWDNLWSVTLDGEIRFPGTYRIRHGETLRQVVERAGGLTDAASPEGAIFLREALREREQEQIEALARRLEADIATLSLEARDTSGATALETGESLLRQLRDVEAVGRLVIDLEQLAARTTAAEVVKDVELRDGDRLLVPKQSQEITVIGETQQNTSHLFQPGLSRDDYIDMSGGMTRRADKRRIYVVRASGAVVASSRSRWFGRRQGAELRPGDTIVVPMDTDRIRPITFWTNVTQILYQSALAVAAIQTFSD